MIISIVMLGLSPLLMMPLPLAFGSDALSPTETLPRLTRPGAVSAPKVPIHDFEFGWSDLEIVTFHPKWLKDEKLREEIRIRGIYFRGEILEWFKSWQRSVAPEAQIPHITIILDRFSEQQEAGQSAGPHLAWSHPLYKKAGKNGFVIDLDLFISPQAGLTMVHELQHVISLWARDHKEVDWINEGLSQWLEYRFKRVLPNNALNSFFEQGAAGHGYANGTAFFLYLERHFGGEALMERLIFQPDSGHAAFEGTLSTHALGQGWDDSTALLSLKSVLANYFLALAMNRTGISRKDLWSLPSVLHGRRMNFPSLFLFNQETLAIPARGAIYRRIFPRSCGRIHWEGAGVKAFLKTSEKTLTPLGKAKICAPADVVIMNLEDEDALVRLDGRTESLPETP